MIRYKMLITICVAILTQNGVYVNELCVLASEFAWSWSNPSNGDRGLIDIVRFWHTEFIATSSLKSSNIIDMAGTHTAA